nr:hypothetical protein [Tanacetum cinerariifolium]
MSSSTSPEQAPPSPKYVPGPDYAEYVASSNNEMLVEDWPLLADASPTALSPGCVANFDPLEEDPEVDLVDYPVDGGYKEEEESSKDDDDEKEKEAFEEDEDEEEEHLALATLLHYLLLTMSLLLRRQNCLRPMSLQLHHHLDHLRIGSDIPETDMTFWKMLCLTAFASRFEVGECSTIATARQAGHTLARCVNYGFIDTMDTSIRAFESRVMTTVKEVNKRVTYLATTQRQNAHELYVRDEDKQDDQDLLRAHISLLTRERRYFRTMASPEDRRMALKALIRHKRLIPQH